MSPLFSLGGLIAEVGRKRRMRRSRYVWEILIEPLEVRRLLTTITASQLAPPLTTTGAMFENKSYLNGTLLSTANDTAVGSATFNGQSCDEVDSTTLTALTSTTTQTKDYFAVTSSGLVAYGETSTTTVAGQTTSSTITYSPAEIAFPPSISSGQTLPAVMFSDTKVTTNPDGSQTTTSATFSVQFSLASTTTPITVGTTHYNATELDLNETMTPEGGTATMFTQQEWVVPGVGIVKEVTSNNGQTIEVDLVSTTLSGGGGGGGGGGTGGAVTPTVAASTVPSAIVAGAKLHGSIKVDLANSASTVEKGYTTNVYASTTTTLDTTTDPLVASTSKGPAIPAGKSAVLNIPVSSLPSTLGNGTFYLFVETADSSGNTESTQVTNPVVVAAPFVTLSETIATTLAASLVSGTTTHGAATTTITNNGNVKSSGSTQIALSASLDSGVVGTAVTSVAKNLQILPGKSVRVVIPIKSIPALANGNYFFVVQVTDPFAGGTSIGSTSGTTTIAAPFVTLAATLGPVTKLQAGDTLTVTNNGNVADDSAFSATIGFSTDSAGADKLSGTANVSLGTLHVASGKSGKVHLTGWKSLAGELTSGATYFLFATITDSAGNSALAVSSTSFTD